MILSAAQIPTLLISIFTIIFSYKIFKRFKRTKRKELLFLSMFFMGNFLIFFFGFLRLYFPTYPKIDGFFWWISHLSSSLCVLGFLLFSSQVLLNNKKQRQKIRKIITIIFLIHLLLASLLPQQRIITDDGTEWEPHFFTLIFFVIIALINLVICGFFLIFGFKNKNLKSLIFGFGVLLSISGTFLDGVGYFDLVSVRSISLIGLVLIFLSYNFD